MLRIVIADITEIALLGAFVAMIGFVAQAAKSL